MLDQPHADHVEVGQSSPPARGFIESDYGLVTIFFLGTILIGFIAVMVLNRGVFTYTLDDTYIHMAVAEELAGSGHYGVNPDEVSAPCSSPLWPFLIVPFARLPGFDLVPLLLNAAAGFATAMLAVGRLRRLMGFRQDDRSGTLLRALVAMCFLLATNAIGLVFTGMEHSLQVLLTVLVVEGMLRMAEGRDPGRWFDLAIVVGPWVRYENMALTFVAVIFCFLQGRRGKAILLGAASVAGLAAFSGYLVSLGLAPMPASITAKSTFEGQDPLVAVLKNLKASLMLGRGMLVALCVSLLLGLALVWRGEKTWRLAAVGLAAAGFLHLIAGAYGWVNRYEIYILTGLIWGLAVTIGKMLENSGIRPSRRLAWVLLPLLFPIGGPYLQGLAQLPIAANNIYEQQYHMHRFAVDFWKKPLAVNDLGWVSYRNDRHILDLWGLASPVALKARMAKKDPEWITELAAKHDVKLAMIYSAWFPNPPAGWKKVAVLRLTRKCVVPAGSEVAFYAMKSEAVPEIMAAADRFRQSLPQGEMLEICAD